MPSRGDNGLVRLNPGAQTPTAATVPSDGFGVATNVTTIQPEGTPECVNCVAWVKADVPVCGELRAGEMFRKGEVAYTRHGFLSTNP